MYRELLHSSQLDVSYFAAGVVAHLLADDTTRSMMCSAVAQELRDELVSVHCASVSHLCDNIQVQSILIISQNSPVVIVSWCKAS